MNVYGRELVLFPEYHLSDFPPQINFTQCEAEDVLCVINVNKADLIISGYVERFENNIYSSCLILDQGKAYNLRKKYPYKDENKFIISGDKGFQVISLSIGKSYFFICNDITYELDNNEFSRYLEENSIENIFLISAMGMNFDKCMEKLKSRAKQLGAKNVIYCDRFNGIGLFNV